MPSKVEDIAMSDISLAEAVLAHIRWRFTHGKLVGSKPGYIVECFREPGKYGFTRDEVTGLWSPPPGESMESPEKREEDYRVKLAKREEERRTYEERRKKEMAIEENRLARWEGRSEDAKERIRRIVRTKSPLFATSDNESFTFRSACVLMAESLEREGKL